MMMVEDSFRWRKGCKVKQRWGHLLRYVGMVGISEGRIWIKVRRVIERI